MRFKNSALRCYYTEYFFELKTSDFGISETQDICEAFMIPESVKLKAVARLYEAMG